MKHTVRAHAEYLGGITFRYHYPCGHYRTEELKVRRGNRKVPVTEQMAQMYARWWSKEHGGVSIPVCPTCEHNKNRGA
jgi:hypothetical protein